MSQAVDRLTRLSRWAGLILVAPCAVGLLIGVCVPDGLIRVGDKTLRVDSWALSLSPPPAKAGMLLLFPQFQNRPRVWFPGMTLPTLQVPWLPIFSAGYALLWSSVILQRATRRRGFAVLPNHVT